MRRIEHLLAAAVSGPPGRFVAFALDFVAALWRGFRGNPHHPEQGGAGRRPPSRAS